MRFVRLKFTGYGVFHGEELSFPAPADGGDFHFVLGDNEAGKSTALAGITDLLFGVEARTPYAFYPGELALEAEVEQSGEVRRYRRRKGLKNTLMDEAGNLADEALLRDWLRVRREEFSKMFGLNCSRLRAGGDELLLSGGDLSAALLSAHSGVTGLSVVADNLEKEADRFWGAKKAQRRAYQQAKERYEDADERKKRAMTHPEELRALEEKLSGLRKEREDAGARLRECKNRRRQIDRILSARPLLRRGDDMLSELKRLEGIATLPENAHTQVSDAVGRINKARIHLESCGEQIEGLRRDREIVKPDYSFLKEGLAIQDVAGRRELARQAESDIPLRQSEIDGKKERIMECAQLLGRSAKSVREIKAPPSARRNRLLDLKEEGGGIFRDIKMLQGRLQTPLPPGEKQNANSLNALRAAIKDARGSEAGERIKNAQKESGELAAGIAVGLKSLAPLWEGDAEQLAALTVPMNASLDAYKQGFAGLNQKAGELEAERKQAENRLKALQEKNKEIKESGIAASEEDMRLKREERDSAWERIRDMYVLPGKKTREQKPAQRAASVADGFAALVREADDLADERFKNAEHSARLDDCEKGIQEARAELTKIDGAQKQLQEEIARKIEKWRREWRRAGIIPLTPDEMREWLRRRDDVLRNLQAKNAKDKEINRLREDEKKTGLLLSKAVLRAGKPPPGKHSLAGLIEIAERIAEEIQKTLARREEAESQREKDVNELARAEKNRDEWGEQWKSALTACGLNAETAMPELQEKMDLFDEVEDCHRTVEELDERIREMKATVRGFGSDVTRLAKFLPPAERSSDCIGLAQKLLIRLQEENSKSDRRRGIEDKLKDLQRRRDEWQSHLSSEEEALEPLIKRAGVKDHDALLDAAEKSGEKLALKKKNGDIRRDLMALGGGKSPEDLKRESDNEEEDD